MKKYLFLIVICSILIAMPVFSAAPVRTNENLLSKTLAPLPEEEYDGTFIGGLGQLYKENDEWQYDVYSYIAGLYRDRNYKILYGNIYNLDQEEIGTITMISSRFFLIGRITDLEGNKAPIIGFIFDYDDDNFIGRIMSILGPAPHMWGQYIPN